MAAQTINDTEVEVKTKALFDKLPYILTLVRSEALVNTVVVTLALVKAETSEERR